MSRALVMLVLCVGALAAYAQTFTTLIDFDGGNGAEPVMSFVQGRDGNLFGTTAEGSTGYGTIFSLTPAGKIVRSHSLDEVFPEAALTEGGDGNFYTTTYFGGEYGSGSVIKITPNSVVTVLYSFCSQPGCSDGVYPLAPLIQATDGTLYGTTSEGGSQSGGTVFRITTGGAMETLYNFCSLPNCTDGSGPYAGLVQGTDGNFYGTTLWGGPAGSFGDGTIFKITPSGTLTTLHSFCVQSSCHDGSHPQAGLIQATDGEFYGTTSLRGDHGGGTVFKMTQTGRLTTLYGFCLQSGCLDGESPEASLVQATDGNFYGTTYYGGEKESSCFSGCGTVFQITPSGALTTLHVFTFSDGNNPDGALFQATDGRLYGTTVLGGDTNCYFTGCGTIFDIDMGLGPFVTFVRSAGRVGETGPILGQGLAGTTSVSINGIQARFAVISDTLIRATVPAGATTGYVTVITPSGTLTSNVPFHVIP